MTDEAVPASLTSLPLDILLLILPYLCPGDVLAFCSSTPIFHNNFELVYAPSYWNKAIRDTFRVPNQPVVQGDGRRWRMLYRRMRTQTRLYGWGGNDRDCLGGALAALHEPRKTEQEQGQPVVQRLQPGRPFRMAGNPHTGGRRVPSVIQRHWPMLTGVAWPLELKKEKDMAAIADLQCGGWSYTVLDSKGSLYTTGVLDGLARGVASSRESLKLQFPPGFDASTSANYSAYTAIKQFSSGRAHVLGLSDSGRIWSWDNSRRFGLHVKFLTVDLVEGDSGGVSGRIGAVRQVMAGWNRSTAYVVGTGIVTWEPSNTAEIQGRADQSTGDGMLVLDLWIVPNSGFLQSQKGPHKGVSVAIENDVNDYSVDDVGEVVNYAVLAEYILFVTHVGKVFASKIPHSDGSLIETVQLIPFATHSSTFAIDVQGSRGSFAIFKKNGEVLTGDDHYLNTLWETRSSPLPVRQKLRKIPCLQNAGVISMAFGDYHYHALHSDGTISSYGHEPQRCGALGLGGQKSGTFRGLKVDPRAHDLDRKVLSECYTTGRRVYFEEEKRKWLDHLLGEGREESATAEAKERRAETERRDDVKAEVGEWIEERLNRWEAGWKGDMSDASATEASSSKSLALSPEIVDTVNEDDGDDGLPPYFALSVAAAGWHSGAIVLVNEHKAQKTRAKYQRGLLDVARSHLTSSGVENHNEAGGNAAEGSSRSIPKVGLLDSVKGFLGLTNNDRNTSNDVASGSEHVNEEEEEVDRSTWRWSDEEFPRLKLKSGEVLPGSVPVLDWRAPEWKVVEECDE